MEQSKKQLKIASIFILIFAALSIIDLVLEVFFGNLSSIKLPADAPENTLLVAQIILVVVSFILLLPNIYVGLKGLSVLKKPTTSEAHIVWAIILLAFALLSLPSPVMGLIKQEAILWNVIDIICKLADVFMFFIFIKSAKEIARG